MSLYIYEFLTHKSQKLYIFFRNKLYKILVPFIFILGILTSEIEEMFLQIGLDETITNQTNTNIRLNVRLNVFYLIENRL